MTFVVLMIGQEVVNCRTGRLEVLELNCIRSEGHIQKTGLDHEDLCIRAQRLVALYVFCYVDGVGKEPCTHDNKRWTFACRGSQ